MLATDASPAMVELAGAGARALVLPDDALPAADAIVSVGHALNYLPDRPAIDRALVAMAGALLPGGVPALDLLDRRLWRRPACRAALRPGGGRLGPGHRYASPAPDRFVRHITRVVAAGNGSWRRDDERHENVLVDTAAVPAALAEHGVEARVSPSFGDERLPDGMVAVIDRRA